MKYKITTKKNGFLNKFCRDYFKLHWPFQKKTIHNQSQSFIPDCNAKNFVCTKTFFSARAYIFETSTRSSDKNSFFKFLKMICTSFVSDCYTKIFVFTEKKNNQIRTASFSRVGNLYFSRFVIFSVQTKIFVEKFSTNQIQTIVYYLLFFFHGRINITLFWNLAIERLFSSLTKNK